MCTCSFPQHFVTVKIYLVTRDGETTHQEELRVKLSELVTADDFVEGTVADISEQHGEVFVDVGFECDSCNKPFADGFAARMVVDTSDLLLCRDLIYATIMDKIDEALDGAGRVGTTITTTLPTPLFRGMFSRS